MDSYNPRDLLNRNTKIICTIGPASMKPDVLQSLIHNGMEIVRLNFSHGDFQTHTQNVKLVRSLAETENKTIAIQVDLQGPKLRIGQIDGEGIPVIPGSLVTLSPNISLKNPQFPLIPVGDEVFPTLVKSGDRVLIDDGLIELAVRSVTGEQVNCEVVVGGTIKSHKGINLPGAATNLPAITEKDKEDLQLALELGVDWIALSFVRCAEDVKQLRRMIKKQVNFHVPIMAKIERQEALSNIDEIIEVSDAIMVARGDLGIEIHAEQVPMVQKQIIRKCNEAGIPVVTATQMLDSMIRNPRPTRAETSDVANAILDGTDAVMLSGETAVGDYPLESLQTMVRIICEVESKQTRTPVLPFESPKENIHFTIARAVACSVKDAVENLNVAAIIAITASGYTARLVSRYRPQVPILAITPDKRVARQLMLDWGVFPLLTKRSTNTDEMISNALQTVLENGLIKQNDLVVITAGAAGSKSGTTDFMKIHIVQ